MFWSPTVRTDHVKPPQQQHIKKKVSFVWINNSLKIELFLHGNNVLLAGHSHRTRTALFMFSMRTLEVHRGTDVQHSSEDAS